MPNAAGAAAPGRRVSGVPQHDEAAPTGPRGRRPASRKPLQRAGTDAARAVVPSIRLTAGELLEQYRCLERIMSSIRCGNGPSVSRCCFSPSSRPQRNTEHVRRPRSVRAPRGSGAALAGSHAAAAGAICGRFRACLSQALLLQRGPGCRFGPRPRGGSSSRRRCWAFRGAVWGCPTFGGFRASASLAELIGLNVIYSRVRASRAAALSLGSNS